MLTIEEKKKKEEKTPHKYANETDVHSKEGKKHSSPKAKKKQNKIQDYLQT